MKFPLKMESGKLTQHVEIAAKAKLYMEEEKEGKISFKHAEDALTLTMGKKDHRGRVKATGGNVGYKMVYGSENRSTRSSQSEPSSEVVESIRALIRKEFEGELERRVEEALQRQLTTLMEKGHLNSTSIPPVDSTPNVILTHELDPSPLLRELEAYKGPTPCRDSIEDKFRVIKWWWRMVWCIHSMECWSKTMSLGGLTTTRFKLIVFTLAMKMTPFQYLRETVSLIWEVLLVVLCNGLLTWCCSKKRSLHVLRRSPNLDKQEDGR